MLITPIHLFHPFSCALGLIVTSMAGAGTAIIGQTLNQSYYGMAVVFIRREPGIQQDIYTISGRKFHKIREIFRKIF